MNFRAIIYILGWILNIEGAFMLLPFIVSLIYKEPQGIAYLMVSVLCIILGCITVMRKPKNMVFFEKESLVTVSFGWILLSIFGALPFYFTKEIPSFTNALFETVSGFSTTGASILSRPEDLSYASLFWRSFTNWLGGMGVLVFLLAITPLTKGGSPIYLLRAESPGPSVERLFPKLQSTALVLYVMYIALTVLEFIFLILGKMPVFDAITASFATAGTGGFSIKSTGFAEYSPYIQWVVATFMMLFGINFGMYFLLILKKWKKAVMYEEVRYYIGVIIIATAIIFFNIYPSIENVSDALRHSFFQVSSIITTTGFSSTDFNLWPTASKTILVFLMFVGACAGSTGGGMKISRIMVLFKTVKKELMICIHPGTVKKIKVEGKAITHEVQRSITAFFIAYMLLFVISVLIISFENHDIVTTFTSVVATIGDIGPGLEKIGPTGNFAFFSPLSKYVLMFNMLAGRLELYPLLALLQLSMWKSAFKKKNPNI
ncbi:MAG: TrkH family potassium uptake protein [Clostridia bacterium]|nr:TrkH family potassium uptake protein [Clostridia bacterium]